MHRDLLYITASAGRINHHEFYFLIGSNYVKGSNGHRQLGIFLVFFGDHVQLYGQVSRAVADDGIREFALDVQTIRFDILKVTNGE